MNNFVVRLLAAVLVLSAGQSATAGSLNCSEADRMLCELVRGKPCWELNALEHYRF
jgi:hypothetical protein